MEFSIDIKNLFSSIFGLVYRTDLFLFLLVSQPALLPDTLHVHLGYTRLDGVQTPLEEVSWPGGSRGSRGCRAWSSLVPEGRISSLQGQSEFYKKKKQGLRIFLHYLLLVLIISRNNQQFGLSTGKPATSWQQ